MIRRLAKRLTAGAWTRRALSWLGAQYIRFVYVSSRWQVVGGEAPAALWDVDQPFILSFWHGRLMMMPKCWRLEKPMLMLISRHRDGELIANTIKHFDLGSVRGSSHHGGSAAVRKLVKTLKAGNWAGFTPDGPGGPRMRAHDGVIAVARIAEVPIVPCAYATSRRRVLGTWDRFIVPLPFSRGAFVWGAPIEVPRDADAATLEALRREVEVQLNAVTDAADRLVGQAPIAPAPVAAAA